MGLLRDPDRHRYDCSAHHCATSDGDTFGGLGTSREYREEDIPPDVPDALVNAEIARLDRVVYNKKDQAYCSCGICPIGNCDAGCLAQPGEMHTSIYPAVVLPGAVLAIDTPTGFVYL